MSAIEVDLGRCEGHGLCENAAPQVYRLNDDGHVELLIGDGSVEIPSELLAAAQAGARLCPVNALRVVVADAS